MSGLFPRGHSADNGEDVGFLDDEDFFVADGDLGARVLGEQNFLTLLQLHRHSRAFFEAARTDSDDFAFLRFLFGGIRDIQPAAHLVGVFDRADNYAVSKGLDLGAGSRRGTHVYTSVNESGWREKRG